MPPTRTSRNATIATLSLIALGITLGVLHARAWGLGSRSPVLGFDAAQYALAARTLAEHGQFATPFALPIDLVHHGAPPWPLSVVQPGLVVLEAVLERLVPHGLPWPGGGDFASPARREWLPLLISFGCYLALGVLLARTVRRQLGALDPAGAAGLHMLVGFGSGAAFLLDPEAQHLALGGFTELPYTLGLVSALAMLASGRTARHPFAWGLVLGVTGAMRGNLLVLMPVLVAAAWMLAPRQRRGRVASLALAGYVLVLAPWWFYKWRAFGTPGWDLSSLALWDGVGGRTWFTLTHRPEIPALPTGAGGLVALGPKFARQIGVLAAGFATSPAGLWSAVLGAALLWRRSRQHTGAVAHDPAARRAARTIALLLLIHVALSLVVAALGSGWRRYLFPARVPIEAAGLAAAWIAFVRLRADAMGESARRVAAAALVVLALGWGVTQTILGNAEAAAASATRGVPSVATLEDLATQLDAKLARGETVMSNQGSTLAWYARRPVLHLALTPADVASCRARVPFRHIVLVFRDAEHAWKDWAPIVADPAVTAEHPEWGITGARQWATPDGFVVVWLELGGR